MPAFKTSTHVFSVRYRLRDCYGGQSGPMEVLAVTWHTSDDAVASVSLGQVTGQAPGTATITAQWNATSYTYEDDTIEFGNYGGLGGSGHCESRSTVMSDTASFTVKPRIDSISPARGLIGNTQNVTIHGVGFRSGLTVNAGNGITATISSVTNDQITANFAINAQASGGNRAVTVTSIGQTSNSKNFFVQTPHAFKAISVTPENLGCDSGAAGHGAKVIYRVVDGEGQPIMKAGMTSEEIVSSIGGGFDDYRPFATPRETDASGIFNDVPVGTCFIPPTSNFCIDVRQEFRIKIPTSGGEQIYFLGTQARSANHGKDKKYYGFLFKRSISVASTPHFLVSCGY